MQNTKNLGQVGSSDKGTWGENTHIAEPYRISHRCRSEVKDEQTGEADRWRDRGEEVRKTCADVRLNRC